MVFEFVLEQGIVQDLHEVVAIDSSTEGIEHAKRLGVDARVADFPDFEEEPFDVILFTF